MNLSAVIPAVPKPGTILLRKAGAVALFCATTIGTMALPEAVKAQSAVLFQSQPQITAPGKCSANTIPNSVLKSPRDTRDKGYARFFGKWCRDAGGKNQEVAIIANGEYSGAKQAHTVKFLLSTNGSKPQTGWGVMFWDTRQNRWSLFTGGHIGWLRSNGDQAFGVAKKSGKNFRVAKGSKQVWGSYRKVR